LYDTNSPLWKEGEARAAQEWFPSGAGLIDPAGISFDPDWVHPNTACSVAQTEPLPGKAFLVVETFFDFTQEYHLTILNGSVYQFLPLCEW
jgi:hypothetical protein